MEQLVYKLYKNDEGLIGKNNRYRQQLLNNLKNDCVSIKQIKNLNYYKKDLVNLFLKYNGCNSNTQNTYVEKKQKRDALNITIRPGLNSSSLDIDPPGSLRDAEFDNELSLRFGIELEYVLPFNKNKWSIILEPTYQSYNSEAEILGIDNPGFPLDRTFVADYKSIELPLGVRYSFYLSKKMKLFINASFMLDFDVNSNVLFGLTNDFDDSKEERIINSRNNFAFGFGAKYNKLSLEFRQASNREVLGNVVL